MHFTILQRSLFPEAMPVKGLTSWARAQKKIDAASEETRRRFWASYLEEAKTCSCPAVRQALDGVASIETNLGTSLALLGAAKADAFKVFAKRHGDTYCHEVHPEIWRGTLTLDLLQMALSGRFLPISYLLDPSRVEFKMAGADLYIGSAAFEQVMKEPAGSESARERIAREIIQEFQRDNPGAKMRYEQDFAPAFQAMLPGASVAQKRKAWAASIPEGWKSGGRPRTIKTQMPKPGGKNSD